MIKDCRQNDYYVIGRLERNIGGCVATKVGHPKNLGISDIEMSGLSCKRTRVMDKDCSHGFTEGDEFVMSLFTIWPRACFIQQTSNKGGAAQLLQVGGDQRINIWKLMLKDLWKITLQCPNRGIL